MTAEHHGHAQSGTVLDPSFRGTHDRSAADVMYLDDHPPAHFHAKYGEYEVQVAIASDEILTGELPRRARALVAEWAELHHDELMDDWERAVRQEPLRRIEPLP